MENIVWGFSIKYIFFVFATMAFSMGVFFLYFNWIFGKDYEKYHFSSAWIVPSLSIGIYLFLVPFLVPHLIFIGMIFFAIGLFWCVWNIVANLKDRWDKTIPDWIFMLLYGFGISSYLISYLLEGK